MKEQTGYSLIELMVILVVISISLGIGIPSYRAFIADNQLTSFTNDFVAAITLARTEAIRTGDDISVISANDDWSGGGWNIANDADNNGVAADAEVLRSYAHRQDATLSMTNNIIAPGNTRVIKFDRRGYMIEPGAAFQFTVCDDRTGETGRQLSVNVVGRVDLNPEFVCP